VVRRLIASGGPLTSPDKPPADGDAAAAPAPPNGSDAPPPPPPASAEGLLQWLLGVALALSEVPAPLQALRLLLVCGHVSSEEAGLELLTYEFFEQARRPLR
jgi:hypothetical protein